MSLFKKLLKVAGPIVGVATGNPMIGAAIGGLAGAMDGGGVEGVLSGALGGYGAGSSGGGLGALSSLFSGMGGGGNPLSMLTGGIKQDSYGPDAPGSSPSYGPSAPQASAPQINPLQLLQAFGGITHALQDRSIQGSLTPQEILNQMQEKQAKDAADSAAFTSKFNNPQPFRRQTANPV